MSDTVTLTETQMRMIGNIGKWRIRKAYFGSGWMTFKPGKVEVGFNSSTWEEAFRTVEKFYPFYPAWNDYGNNRKFRVFA